MAVIQPTLSITSNANSASTNAGPLSFSLALSATPISGTLTVDTVEGEIFTIGHGANTDLVDGSALSGAFVAGTNGCYIYMKNTMTSGTDTICIGIVKEGETAPTVDDGTTDLTRSNSASLRTFTLMPGEFAFFPYDYCGHIYAQASSAGQTLEFFRFDRA